MSLVFWHRLAALTVRRPVISQYKVNVGRRVDERSNAD